jgi:hypothetical protein
MAVLLIDVNYNSPVVLTAYRIFTVSLASIRADHEADGHSSISAIPSWGGAAAAGHAGDTDTVAMEPHRPSEGLQREAAQRRRRVKNRWWLFALLASQPKLRVYRKVALAKPASEPLLLTNAGTDVLARAPFLSRSPITSRLASLAAHFHIRAAPSQVPGPNYADVFNVATQPVVSNPLRGVRNV